jgi:glycosyltransferase involved in cell wall biosynthesis
MKPVIVSVGTLEPRKNMAVAITAMRQLTDYDFIHSGSPGWKTHQLHAEARQMSNVRILGYADDATIHCLYRCATLAVFPSLYEGFHLPPLEAMALGCPVIASDIPVHREVLGDAAIYVDPTDSPGWASAIRYLVENPAERSRLSEAGRSQAAKYSWDESARQLLNVIEEAMEERNGSRR